MDFFRPLRRTTTQTWKELGGYQSVFSIFGGDIYRSETVRACIRPLAEFSSKAEAKCSDKRIERILNNRPNIYMNGKDFLYKVRTRLEVNNNCFIYIQRDADGKANGFYPVPYSYFEAVEYLNGLFIKFHFTNSPELVLPWEDLAVVRKDYNKSDFAGDDNTAVLDTLDLMKTTNQGMANAIKATANLRGLLKSTKAMLAPEDIKRQKDDFVRDYLSLENEGGIAALDATQDFTPISMNPITATYDQMREIRENIYRYFGVNDDIVMCNMTPEKIEAFYELRIEPFLVELSTELTSKLYPGKAGAYNNYVVFEANKLQFASLDKKIQMFKEVVLYGGMLVNEWRAACNMPPIEGGDKRIMRLDAQTIDSDGTSDKEDEDNE